MKLNYESHDRLPGTDGLEHVTMSNASERLDYDAISKHMDDAEDELTEAAARMLARFKK